MQPEYAEQTKGVTVAGLKRVTKDIRKTNRLRKSLAEVKRERTHLTVAVDFDGTIAEHIFPEIGKPVPGAFAWMKRWQKAGARLILWTMRSDGQEAGDVLTQAVEFCRANGVEFFGVNTNPEQDSWTSSPKAYAQVYVDDAAMGCPLLESKQAGGRPMVDWSIVGPAVMAEIRRG